MSAFVLILFTGSKPINISKRLLRVNLAWKDRWYPSELMDKVNSWPYLSLMTEFMFDQTLN